MDDKSFNEIIRALNKQYLELFEEIPCITDYSCTRDEYVSAMQKAILEKRELRVFLKEY